MSKGERIDPNIDNIDYSSVIGIRSIQTGCCRYLSFSSSFLFSCPQLDHVSSRNLCKQRSFHTLLSTLCSAALLSCDSAALRAVVRETHVPQPTDAITDQGNEKLKHSLELMLYSDMKINCLYKKKVSTLVSAILALYVLGIRSVLNSAVLHTPCDEVLKPHDLNVAPTSAFHFTRKKQIANR